jgi:RND family efflux transporter MFP subunit
MITRNASANAAKPDPGKVPDVSQAPTPVRVEVARPKVGDMDRTTTQPGTVQSYESASLFAGVSGYLKTQTVDIGDRVEAGQVLATVDVPDLEKQVQRTAAALDQARARVLQMKARAVSARAEEDAARAAIPRAEALLKSKSAELRYQQQRLQRIRELAASRSVEDKLVDEYTSHRDAVREAEIAAQESVTSAKANLAAMVAKVQAADADIQEAEAEVKVAQAELEKAQVMVKFATIVAPFKGVITHRSFFPGDYVRAATEGGVHAPLLKIERTDRMRVVVQVPDRDVPYTDPGDPAVVELDALPGEKLPIAKVSRIARSEDPQTRLMHVEIDMPNPTGRICQGMYGRVKIILQKSDLLSVPSSCLIERSETGKAYVYVVRDGAARRLPVRISEDNGLKVGIVSGLKATDDVVLRPGSGLTDGAAVGAAHDEETGTK